MQIARILIKNYRSINTLEFRPERICTLVGQNNAGKTNVLAALNFLLGESWPSRQRLDTSDYFEEDTAQPIRIEVEFHPNPGNIQKVWLHAPWEAPSETKVTYFGNATEYRLSNEVRDKCAMVYLDASRNLEAQLRTSAWTLLGRIIRLLDEDFRLNTLPEQQAALHESFQQAMQLLRTALFDQFETSVRDAFGDQLRRTSHRVELEFHAFDPLSYYKSLEVHIWEDQKRRTPSESGQGMRNLILLALFRAYASVFRGSAIIAIEEPEIFLHPHAQRSMFAVFQALAESGAQVFYSTHSPTFLEVPRFHQVCLVRKGYPQKQHKPPLQTTVTQVSVPELLAARTTLHPDAGISQDGMIERYRNICTPVHNEAFFSRNVVIVEGPTEESSIPVYARALGQDFDFTGVSVVSAGGKTNIDQLFQLYSSFGLPAYVIFDADTGRADAETPRWNRVLLRLLQLPESDYPVDTRTPTATIFATNFEATLQDSVDQVRPGLYAQLTQEAHVHLGPAAGKGLVARFIALRLVAMAVEEPLLIPEFIRECVAYIAVLGEQAAPNPLGDEPLDDPIPF